MNEKDRERLRHHITRSDLTAREKLYLQALVDKQSAADRMQMPAEDMNDCIREYCMQTTCSACKLNRSDLHGRCFYPEERGMDEQIIRRNFAILFRGGVP